MAGGGEAEVEAAGEAEAMAEAHGGSAWRRRMAEAHGGRRRGSGSRRGGGSGKPQRKWRRRGGVTCWAETGVAWKWEMRRRPGRASFGWRRFRAGALVRLS